MADLLSEAQTLYTESLDALRDQRRQIEEDLRFSDPSDPQQWDETIKYQRETDPGGARPCLVFDQLSQYVQNVTGQIEQRPAALHAIPVEGGADKRVAEQLDGFFRYVEYASRAQQQYMRAETSAARAGVGYLVVRPNYVNRALNWQEPRIDSVGDPLNVVFDPWSTALDGSDATFGFLLTPLSHREFEAQFGAKADKVSFGSKDTYVRDERESILVAEAWRLVESKENRIVVVDPHDRTGAEMTLSEDEYWTAKKEGKQYELRGTYMDTVRRVKWAKMSGAAILDKETEYPAESIGIVPVYGYVGWSDGRMRYCGIPRRARHPQQAYNYHMSEIRAYMNDAPRAPWTVPIRAIQGLETLWDRASVDRRAYLPYHDQDESGPIAAPARAQPSVNLQNLIQGAMQAKDDIQAAVGMYQANLGAPSNEQSGVAIEQRKAQGEASTANFPAHLSASIAQVGRLVMQMIPKLIDTRRQLRILGIDHTPSTITMDPKMGGALQEGPEGLTVNPNVGRYDVRVVVGAAYSTRRQQAQEAFDSIMRSNPEMVPAIAPIWAQSMDIPYADKLAQVLTAMAPDAVKAILQPDQQEPVEKVTAERDQLKQALQEAIKTAQEAMAEAQEANAKLDAKEDENAIKAFDAETKRMQAVAAALTPEQVQQIAAQTFMQLLQQPNPMEEPGEVAEPMQAQPMPQEMAPMEGPSPLEPEQPAEEML